MKLDVSSREITIGISACLAGEMVRYDGRSKIDRLLLDALGGLFRLVTVCPEVECGLPVPRPEMRLEGDPGHPRLVVTSSGADLTEMMESYCSRRVQELGQEKLCGFVFKERSPSSGLAGVPVYAGGKVAGSGSGLFAAAFVRAFPGMPLAEAEQLQDRERLLDFVAQVRRYHENLGGVSGSFSGNRSQGQAGS